MLKTFKTGADLGGYLFRITDNGGATADRYTVVFSDGDYLSMSAYPSHPQGVSMWGEGLDVGGLSDRVEEGREVDLSWGCLPETIRAHVLYRLNEGWADFLEKIEARDPSAVAASRDDAEENDGLHDTAGKGIYIGEDGALWIKATDDPAEDYGPYDDAAKALRMTMPDEYSLSGPEYQSTALGNGGAHSEEPHPEIMALVARLERAVENDERLAEVDTLEIGDLIDLAGDPIADPAGDDDQFEFEYQTVTAVETEGPYDARTVIVSLEGLSNAYAFPSGHRVRFKQSAA